MCASECRFLTLNLELLELERGASSEGGDEGDDVGVLRPEEKWDMNETTRHWHARPLAPLLSYYLAGTCKEEPVKGIEPPSPAQHSMIRRQGTAHARYRRAHQNHPCWRYLYLRASSSISAATDTSTAHAALALVPVRPRGCQGCTSRHKQRRQVA